MSEEVQASEKRKMRIKIESNDGTVIEVDEDAAYQCRQIKQMIEDLGIVDPDDPGLQEPVKISSLSGKILQKIMDWCVEHRGEVFVPKARGEDPRTELTEKDEEFMDITNEELIELLMGAEFLVIPGLVDIITQKIANMARGLTVEQIREVYNLDDDLDPEDAAEVRRDVGWLNH